MKKDDCPKAYAGPRLPNLAYLEWVIILEIFHVTYIKSYVNLEPAFLLTVGFHVAFQPFNSRLVTVNVT